MYTPHPIPTLAPSARSAYEGMGDIITALWNRISNTLQSIPVIPNQAGLFDAQGNWLTPVFSFYDFMIAAICLGAFISLFITLSGYAGRGLVSSTISSASKMGSQRDLPPAEHYHLHQEYKDIRIMNVRLKK